MTTSVKKITAADLFAGAGGTSTGLALAAAALGVDVDLVAVNHWQVAVNTHTKNHPWARHLCADIASIDPTEVCPGGRLDLLVASPSCTHHSRARGGKPRANQSRASGWHVLHWAEALDVGTILVENVADYLSWGPLDENGQPIERLKGATFVSWVRALESLGYTVEWKILNAADYGECTTRRRLFVQACKTGRPVWPAHSHAGKWRGAEEIIDWGLPSQSIFQRKKALSPNTLKRIEAGLEKFGGQPFLALLHGTSGKQLRSSVCSMQAPVPTLESCGHVALCEPFVIPMEHGGRGAIRPVSSPLPTITTARGGALGLCQPFLTQYYGNSTPKPVTSPLDTVTTHDRHALVEPVAVASDNGEIRMDIRFRMLQAHEYAAAMGFDDYVWTGTKTEQVKQIGNAVSVRQARALCDGILRKYAGLPIVTVIDDMGPLSESEGVVLPVVLQEGQAAA